MEDFHPRMFASLLEFRAGTSGNHMFLHEGRFLYEHLGVRHAVRSEYPPETSTFSSHTLEKHSQQSEGDSSSKPPALTIWNDKKNEDESKGFKVNPEAVTFYGDSGDVLFYPALSVRSEDLRNTFYMQRRRRPMLPAPTSCPMPDKQRSGLRRDRLYLLYLQPWVLESSWALPGIVPHICCLHKVEDQTCAESTSLYNYR